MIIYQIYPRSFYSLANKNTGDIAGITSKLKYIKSLGIDYIWISPFFQSPMKDFGYDVSDYRQVDPLFGTMQDFDTLIEKAKHLSIKIMVDLVASHTSQEHQWFKDSINRKNDKDDWYLWANAKADGTPPNNWLSVFGGSAWQWNAQRKKYYFHTFLASQPDLNLHSIAAQNQILLEMEFWLKKGVGGFRLDACNHYFQDISLRDNPPNESNDEKIKTYDFQTHVFDQGRPENILFLQRIRKLLDQYDAYSLAEVGGNDALHLSGEYTKNLSLHSAYTFALLSEENSAPYIQQVIETLENKIVSPARPCYAMSNHDKPRVATRWSENSDTNDTAYQMMALLTVMKGNICVYQGEELGLTEADIDFEDLQDPYGKELWPVFKGRDGCRTPMPWENNASGGFSLAKPWLPISKIHKSMSVAIQEKNTDSLLNKTKHLLKFRTDNNIHVGEIKFLKLCDELLAFTRTSNNKRFLCLFNRGKTLKIIDSPDFIKQYFINKTQFIDKTIHLDVNGFCILEIL